MQAIYDRLQDRIFGPQIDQATKRKDLDFDHSTPLEKASLNYRSIAKCRGPLAVGMQGSLVVELDCDVSAKAKTYSRKKKKIEQKETVQVCKAPQARSK